MKIYNLNYSPYRYNKPSFRRRLESTLPQSEYGKMDAGLRQYDGLWSVIP